MSNDISVSFDGMPEFAGMVADMARLTGAEQSKVVRNVARDFCRAALKLTPMADPKVKPQANYWVRLYHRFTGELVTFPGTAAQAAKYGTGRAAGGRIRNRGFAKAGWVGCLRKLGVGVRAPGDNSPSSHAGVALMNEVIKVRFGDIESIEVANQTPPIVHLDQGGPHNPPHNIAARAMHQTLRRMEEQLANLARKQEQRWAR